MFCRRSILATILLCICPLTTFGHEGKIHLHGENIPDFSWPDQLAGRNTLIVDDEKTLVAGNYDYDQIVVRAGGKLIFSDANINLTVGTIQVQNGGVLQIGTPDKPITNGVKVFWKDVPLWQDARDPEQWGLGLIVLGKCTLHGRYVQPHAKVTSNIWAGTSQLTFDPADVASWRVGDRVYIPDTRQFKSSHKFDGAFVWQNEFRKIVGIAGGVVSLDTPLVYNHLGELTNQPAIANTTRSIMFKSVNEDGLNRGHAVAIGRAEIDYQNVMWCGMGRTSIHRPIDPVINRKGRYALHQHHLYGPVSTTGPQYTIKNNVVQRSRAWGIATHGSSYGLNADNVVLDSGGAGIVTEDGNEYENLFLNNYVSLVRSTSLIVSPRGKTRHTTTYPGNVIDGTPVPAGLEVLSACHGDCYWFAGPLNRLVGNIASNFPASAYRLYGGNLPKVAIPNVPGADIHVDSTLVDLGEYGLLEFKRNSAFSGSDAIETWYINSFSYYDPNLVPGYSNIDDFLCWHIRFAVKGNQMHRVRFNNFKAHNDQLSLRDRYEGSIGMHLGMTFGIEINNADVQGFATGLLLNDKTEKRTTFGIMTLDQCTPLKVAGGYFKNRKDIQFTPIGVDVNKTFNPAYTTVDGASLNGTEKVVLLIGNGNQVNFVHPWKIEHNGVRLYFPEQRADWVVPATGQIRGCTGSPEVGLTNQQLWDKYKMATFGQISP